MRRSVGCDVLSGFDSVKKILAYIAMDTIHPHVYSLSPTGKREMATTAPIDPQQRREAILQQAIELLPNMVFAKDAAPETRDDYDRGFRCGLSLIVCVCILVLGGGGIDGRVCVVY